MRDTVSKIKESISIEDVIGSYIKLEKAGSNLKAVCPFHKEKTPSFMVSPSRGSYYCFGCGAKGDIFSFVEAFEGLDFKRALEVLAKRAGVPITYERSEKSNKKDKLYEIMEEATIFFENNLKDMPIASKYLLDRGVKSESIDKFRIGFALDSWDALYKHLSSSGFSTEDINLAGLIKEGNKSGQFYDRFRSRIVFPLCDSSGRVIAFSGRYLEVPGNSSGKDIEPAKYLNSPETPIFSKGASFYGMNLAKNKIREKKSAIIVEGQFDLVLSHQFGFENTIATSGTAFSVNEKNEDLGGLTHFGMIKNIAEKIILAFDGDKAGIRASYRATDLALEKGLSVEIVTIPTDEDPADILKKDSARWGEILSHGKDATLFFSEFLREKSKNKEDLAKNIYTKIVPLLSKIDSEIVRKEKINTISSKLDLDSLSIEKDVDNYLRKNIKTSYIDERSSSEDLPERKDRGDIASQALGLLFYLYGSEDKQKETEEYEKQIKAILGDEYESYKSLAESRKEELLFSLDNEIASREVGSSIFEEVLINLEESVGWDRLDKLREEIDRAEELGDESEALEKIKQFVDQRKKLDVLIEKRTKL